MDNSVLVLTTGGTFDKEYDPETGSLTMPFSTCVDDILRRSGISVNPWISLIPVLKKDSLDLTFDDRELILLHCLITKIKRILIVHGTDTMTQTAEFLQKYVHEKTIVIVGAMIPNSFKESDAPFNLGAGYMATKLLRPGVYVVMHGKVFQAGNVKKLRQPPAFYTIDGSDEKSIMRDHDMHDDDRRLLEEALHHYTRGELRFVYSENKVRFKLNGEWGPYPPEYEKLKAMAG